MTTEALSPSVSDLADELLRVLFQADPLRATLSGVHDHDSELADRSEVAERRLAVRTRALAAAATEVEPSGLGEADRVTLDVVRRIAADTADDADTRKPEWQVADHWLTPVASMLVLLPLATLPEPVHAEAYLRRLAGLDGYLATVADRHRAGVEAGRTPVARLVRASIRQVDGYLAAPERDPLAQPEPPAGWDGAASFRAGLNRVLAEVVRPAFRRYRDTLAEAIDSHGRDDDRVGLCWLSGGEDSYRMLVRGHTTTERTPEELHGTGLDLVARLAEEYAVLGSRVFGSSDPAEVMRRLRDERSLRYATEEEILDEARRAVAAAEEAAPRWFGRLPRQRCRVEPVPAADAARAPGAYYTPASLDGSRPGTYWQNTHDPGEKLRHLLENTAYHEAVPGHHFQSSLALDMQDVPLLRRLIEFNAFDEGWALYCERLADEMGLYASDLSRLGMLSGDSMRAGRLVVDTGMHALGWSRLQAVEFLQRNTPMPVPDIEVEIDRYIADPGQALAYMVGRLEIQRMRADAERRLGDEFDVRAFHDTVLGAGSLPLTTLAGRVEDWVRTRAGTEPRG